MLMRRSTHRRIYTQQGEAYRREIEDARAEARKARADLERFVDSLAPRILSDKPLDGGVRIIVELEPCLLMRETPQELFTILRDRLMRRLTEAGRDYRGDLRQTPAQRMFGVRP